MAWDAETSQELLALHAIQGSGYGIAFSPVGHRLATGADTAPLHIYDATPLPEKP